MKIQIKSLSGNILFEYESENDNSKKTVEKALLEEILIDINPRKQA